MHAGGGVGPTGPAPSARPHSADFGVVPPRPPSSAPGPAGCSPATSRPPPRVRDANVGLTLSLWQRKGETAKDGWGVSPRGLTQVLPSEEDRMKKRNEKSACCEACEKKKISNE
nr:stress response protein NST1-like [Globicephala melas]